MTDAKEDKPIWASRLLEYAKNKYGSAKALGLKLRLPRIAQYTSGKSFPDKDALKKLEVDGLNLNWLMGRSTNPMVSESSFPNQSSVELKDIPLLSEVYAGEPQLLYTEYTGETISFPKTNGHNLFALKVSGNSMETTLKHGDIVVVDMDAELMDGCIVAVVLSNGHQYIKRYRSINNDFIQLSSDSSQFADKIIAKNDIEKIYRVIHGIVQF